ncbi:MAG: hypothetical protein ACKO37_06400 [Vampirovibrionales bacterium]
MNDGSSKIDRKLFEEQKEEYWMLRSEELLLREKQRFAPPRTLAQC